MSHHAFSILFIAALLFATTGCTEDPASDVNDGVNHSVNDGVNDGVTDDANHTVDHSDNDDPAAPAADGTTATDPNTTNPDGEVDVVVEEEVE